MMQADVGSGFLTAAFSLVQNQFLINVSSMNSEQCKLCVNRS